MAQRERRAGPVVVRGDAEAGTDRIPDIDV